ncbi:MAG: SDR family oxidoreductase [Dehalococcoidia bacterium]
MAANGATPERGAVVITGASTGIGAACALRLDGMGFRVFAGVRRPADGDALKAKGSSRLTPLIIDVTDAAQIAAAVDTVRAATGERGLAGLVNNAGIVVAAPLEFVPLDDLRRQLEVNVVGQVAVTQAFLPMLRDARGRIVFMGSIGGRMSTPFIAPYNASKFALEAITDALRLELRPWGIHVSIIEPGSIATPLWDKSQAAADALEQQMPKALEMYGPAVDAVRKAAVEFADRGIPPDAVAKFVAHALTAKTPKTRYIVGRDARLQAALVKIVPDRMRDRLVAGQLKLPR